MDIKENFATTGRQMDAAWRKAISEGKLRANAGLRSVSDFAEANVNKLKDAASEGLLRVVPNPKYRVKLLNVAAHADDVGGTLGAAWAAGSVVGGTLGGMLGGKVNKVMIANVDKLRPVGADQAKAVAALKEARKTGKLIEKGKSLPIGVGQGAKFGVKVGAKFAGAGLAVLSVAGGVMGAMDKTNVKGKQLEAAIQDRMANKKIRERSSNRLKRQA